MSIFNDHMLDILVQKIRDGYDRRVSVPVLRDIMTVVEKEFFTRLAAPNGTLDLGRVGKIDVQELVIPDEPLPDDEPREFYLFATASDELLEKIRVLAKVEEFDLLKPLERYGSSLTPGPSPTGRGE